MRDVSIPAPEFWHGLLYLQAYRKAGQRAYLFGQTRQFGFWYYHPVALSVKTPLPFLLLGGTRLWLLWRHRTAGQAWPAVAAALGAAGVLGVSLASPLDTGLRHILVVYPLVAIAAASGFASSNAGSIFHRRMWVVAGVLFIWQAAVLTRVWPHQLAYFNELAGRDPARILHGSDFDWGQDFLELVQYFRKHPVRELYIAYAGTVDQCAHGLPLLRPLRPRTPTRGWIAISDTYWRGITASALRRDPCDASTTYGANDIRPDWFSWLHGYEPVAVAGTSIRIYHIENLTSDRR